MGTVSGMLSIPAAQAQVGAGGLQVGQGWGGGVVALQGPCKRSWPLRECKRMCSFNTFMTRRGHLFPPLSSSKCRPFGQQMQSLTIV